jgi:hypothetical protein
MADPAHEAGAPEAGANEAGADKAGAEDSAAISDTDTDACRDGFIRGGRCHETARWRMATNGGQVRFFTTWNFFFVFLGLLFAAAVYLPCQLVKGGWYLNSPTSWLVNYVVTPISISSVIAAFCVFIASQGMMAYNFIGALDLPEAEEQAIRTQTKDATRSVGQHFKDSAAAFGRGAADVFGGGFLARPINAIVDSVQQKRDARYREEHNMCAPVPTPRSVPTPTPRPVALPDDDVHTDTVTSVRLKRATLPPEAVDRQLMYTSNAAETYGGNMCTVEGRLAGGRRSTARDAAAQGHDQGHEQGHGQRQGYAPVPKAPPRTLQPISIGSFGSMTLFDTAPSAPPPPPPPPPRRLRLMMRPRQNPDHMSAQLGAALMSRNRPLPSLLRQQRQQRQPPGSQPTQFQGRRTMLLQPQQQGPQMMPFASQHQQPHQPRHSQDDDDADAPPATAATAWTRPSRAAPRGAQLLSDLDDDAGGGFGTGRTGRAGRAGRASRASGFGGARRVTFAEPAEEAPLDRDAEAEEEAGLTTGQIARKKQAVARHERDAGDLRKQALGETSIAVQNISTALQSNFVLHLLPVGIAMLTLFLLSMGTFATANIGVVIGVTGLILIVLFGGYLCVPMRNTETNTNVYGWQKVRYVYGNPPVWPFAAMFVFCLLAMFVIPTFVIGGGTDKLGFWRRLTHTTIAGDEVQTTTAANGVAGDGAANAAADDDSMGAMSEQDESFAEPL